MPRLSYRLIDHPADVYVEFDAEDLKLLFERAAEIMFEVAFGHLDVTSRECVEVDVEADSLEELLVRWLNEWLYISESRGVVASGIEAIELSDERVRGRGAVTPISGLPEGRRMEIKAATFHGLKIEQLGGRFICRVLFDV